MKEEEGGTGGGSTSVKERQIWGISRSRLEMCDWKNEFTRPIRLGTLELDFLGWECLSVGVKERRASPEILVGNRQKIQGPQSLQRPAGRTTEVAYEQGLAIECSLAHFHRLRLEDGGDCQHFDRNPAASMEEVAGRLGESTAGPFSCVVWS